MIANAVEGAGANIQRRLGLCGARYDRPVFSSDCKARFRQAALYAQSAKQNAPGAGMSAAFFAESP